MYIQIIFVTAKYIHHTILYRNGLEGFNIDNLRNNIVNPKSIGLLLKKCISKFKLNNTMPTVWCPMGPEVARIS